MSDGTGDASWKLTEAAEEDLIEIWREGAKRWGPVQADRYADAFEATFALLARFPEMASDRRELTPPLRVHPSGCAYDPLLPPFRGQYPRDPRAAPARGLDDRPALMARPSHRHLCAAPPN